MNEQLKKKINNLISIVVFLILVIALIAGLVINKRNKERYAKEERAALEVSNFPKISLALKLLGFDTPKRYIVLFLNDTELRPGGGFIGSFATFDITKGTVENLSVLGSEKVGRGVNGAVFDEHVPLPIKKKIGIDSWYFRDANWSPDFSIGASEALRLYKEQSGDARVFDGVGAFTTSILGELLKVTGSVTIDGIELTPENVVEKLQYEVEVGYKEKGKTTAERKDILGSLAKELVSRIRELPLTKWGELWDLWKNLVKEKHIFLYATNEDIKDDVEKLGWGGKRDCVPAADCILVVDANLASLKTDLAVTRSYDYTIQKEGENWIGKLTLHYLHSGSFDWKTTRYMSYTRIFIPQGSELISSSGFIAPDNKKLPTSADIFEELGRKVIGGFINIEPGAKLNVELKWTLDQNIVDLIKNNNFKLLFQKQLGTGGPEVIFTLNSGEKEMQEKFMLNEDRLIKIGL